MSQIDALLTLSASDSDESSDAEIDSELVAQRLLGASSSPAPPTAGTPSPVPANAKAAPAQSVPGGATPQGMTAASAQKVLSPPTPGDLISPARTGSSSSTTPSSSSPSSASPASSSSSSSSAKMKSSIRNLLPLLIKSVGGKDTEQGRKIAHLIQSIKSRVAADREAGRQNSFTWPGFLQEITSVVGKDTLNRCIHEHTASQNRRDQKLAINVARRVAVVMQRPMPALGTAEFVSSVTIAWAGIEMWRHASAQERESPPRDFQFAPLMQVHCLLRARDPAVAGDESLARIRACKPGAGLATYEADKRKKKAAPLRGKADRSIVTFGDREKSVVAGPRGFERRTQEYTDQDLRMLQRPKGANAQAAVAAGDEAVSFRRERVQQQLAIACAQQHLSKPSEATQELVSLALHELMRGMLRSLSTVARHRHRRQAGVQPEDQTHNSRKRKLAASGDDMDSRGSARGDRSGQGPTIRRADVTPLLLARQHTHACVHTHAMRDSRNGKGVNGVNVNIVNAHGGGPATG